MRGRINYTRRLLFILAAMSAAVVIAAVWWLCTAPSFSDMRRDGDRLVAAIEQFRTEHGRYPNSLDETGIVPPRSRYGPWRYGRSEDGESFSLSIGDYGKHGFVFFYYSGRGEWYADT